MTLGQAAWGRAAYLLCLFIIAIVLVVGIAGDAH